MCPFFLSNPPVSPFRKGEFLYFPPFLKGDQGGLRDVYGISSISTPLDPFLLERKFWCFTYINA
ncbi:hypothetical protein KSU1_C0281 [Candidatus Jettenia caeni]|uniref:Uncharacterized protein n=1 Tax=Candidatus Jettenia caeni TaxID=247490 RepID=I3IJI2_9BACT|nr:hypothetical protein KSU1_C0281 [Candidatus Jettenia caeni]